MKRTKSIITALAFLLSAFISQAQNKQIFSFQGDTIQQFIVPASGVYLLDVSGAQGGPPSNGSRIGGKGARMQGYAQLIAGDTLLIAAGGAGKKGSTSNCNGGNNPPGYSGGGGGGGSSIVKKSGSTLTPLIFAGGGGGGGNDYDGSGATTSVNGGSAYGQGGINGQGGEIGQNSSEKGGAGGGGYYSNGQSHYSGNGNSLIAEGGFAYLNGNLGGTQGAYAINNGEGYGGAGGFGGGGKGGTSSCGIFSGNHGGGGGGGGWSGGGGANPADGGGGGGSYLSPVLNTVNCLAVGGAISGNGSVIIEQIGFSNSDVIDTTYQFVDNTFQYFTVPSTGYYLIKARGAQGGPASNFSYIGGNGAHMQGYFLLREGDRLKIAVGGRGFSGSTGTNDPMGGGGGGGSSVVIDEGNTYNPLLFAGGGGGGASYHNGSAAGITVSGNGGNGGANGTNGGGGGIGSSDKGGAGGAGYFTDGGTHLKTSLTAYQPTLSSGGQAYVSGNHGGYFCCAYTDYTYGGKGGWGGGGQGGYSYSNTDGGGGGGGGYSGGGGGNPEYGGGGGGSFSVALCGSSDSSGVNTGNGSVSISGPNVSIDTVNTPGPTYTWAANGVTYQHSGTYYHIDQANCIVQVLDLSIGGLGGCLNYTRIDTTITSCGSYTSPLNGRTYTENTTDSFRLGCNFYVVRLIVTLPKRVLGNMITGQTSAAASEPLQVCKSSTQTFFVKPVPYATAYQWTLPSGATGTSTTNSINVQFSSRFSGGNICVTPVNACGTGEPICRAVTVLNTPPTGRLQIAGPAEPFISGNYSVSPIAGATTYTWSVSNNEAVIVSGQGTPNIQLTAQSGFTRASLSVVASNCRGTGSRGTLVITNNRTAPAGLAVRKSILDTEEISIYPNPSNGLFTISLPSFEMDAALEVYSTDGRLVYQKNIPSNTTQALIDLQQPAAGLYQVRVVVGEEVRVLKLVVQ